jgi:hypothetical protein
MVRRRGSAPADSALGGAPRLDPAGQVDIGDGNVQVLVGRQLFGQVFKVGGQFLQDGIPVLFPEGQVHELVRLLILDRHPARRSSTGRRQQQRGGNPQASLAFHDGFPFLDKLQYTPPPPPRRP